MRCMRVAFVIMASLFAGGVWGYVGGRNATGEGPKMLTQVYALGEYETLTGLQYQQASSDQGKKALLDLLDFMRQLNAGQGNAIGKAFEIDRDIAYTRLALLEEQTGNEEDSQKYMRKALDDFKRRPNDDMREPELRDMVAKLDSKPHYAFPGVFTFRQAIR